MHTGLLYASLIDLGTIMVRCDCQFPSDFYGFFSLSLRLLLSLLCMRTFAVLCIIPSTCNIFCNKFVIHKQLSKYIK